VARLASALEGPNSPIDAILATEIANDQASKIGESERVEASLGESEPSGGGNLADRIRALQTHASRLPHDDKPN